MTGLRQTLKKITPAPIWDAARATYDALHRLPEVPSAYLHPWRQESIHHLVGLKDIHRGQRCFIIGNGPSLRQTDLTKLRGEFTFGLNRIYLLFLDLGFTTTYFLSMNDLVIEQCAAEILALPMPKFLTWRSHRFFTALHPSSFILPTFLYTTYTGPKFARNVTGRLWEGATVTYVALQLAYHMGFSQVILIGVDHNFVTKGDANKTVTSQGDDPNHFAPNYFGKGFKWQLPDLETSERAYRMAKAAYEADGRQVLDATIGGKLTVFPKADYLSLFCAAPTQ
ncbi:MAG: DUF115 domain-containing protein [Chloroflexi bacterium]|nr:DUF115 domain-containing protein [Chloroflexota bacterium]